MKIESSNFSTSEFDQFGRDFNSKSKLNFTNSKTGRIRELSSLFFSKRLGFNVAMIFSRFR